MRTGNSAILKSSAAAALALLAVANISLGAAQNAGSSVPLLSCRVLIDGGSGQTAAGEAECGILVKLTRDAGPNWWQGSRSAFATLRCSVPIGLRSGVCEPAAGPQAAELSRLLTQGFQAVEAQALPLRISDARCRSAAVEPEMRVSAAWDEHREVLQSVGVEHRVVCRG